MSITAVIKRPNIISANTVALTTTQSAPPVELRNTVSINQNYIHSLLDVVEDHPQDGSTLVYNAQLNKYFVQPVVVKVSGLDGGVF